MMKHVVILAVVLANLVKLRNLAKAGTLLICSADRAWRIPEKGWKSGVIEVLQEMMVMPVVETLLTLQCVGLQVLLR